MKVLVTGSCGLIGSEACLSYLRDGHEVLGFDNNLRKYFFGPDGDTSLVKKDLEKQFKNYEHKNIDIRNFEQVADAVKKFKPDLIIHTAAQPSHDWAAKEPFTDFSVNANGTLNLLEACRLFCADAVFLFMSTNKVYGDAPNFLPLTEEATRFEFKGKLFRKGIDETLSVDQCLHSLFGASKLSADVLCQEYGRYFKMKVGVFRGGCLTGSRHASVPLHGFLSYIIHCAISGKPYQVIGYKGKQVRDQIHSADVIQAMELFRKDPKHGEVYNLGGGFENSASILEIISILNDDFGVKLNYDYKDEARKGDHIVYYSDLTKLKSHFPAFKLRHSLRAIIEEILKEGGYRRQKAA